MTEHGKQKTKRFPSSPLFSAFASSGKPDALPLHNVKLSENGRQNSENGYLIRSRSLSTASFEARRLRRAFRPSRKTTIFKPYISSEYLKPITKAFRPPSSLLRLPRASWWSQTGSNRRPHACKARALPTELWPRVRDW